MFFYPDSLSFSVYRSINSIRFEMKCEVERQEEVAVQDEKTCRTGINVIIADAPI